MCDGYSLCSFYHTFTIVTQSFHPPSCVKSSGSASGDLPGGHRRSCTTKGAVLRCSCLSYSTEDLAPLRNCSCHCACLLKPASMCWCPSPSPCCSVMFFLISSTLWQHILLFHLSSSPLVLAHVLNQDAIVTICISAIHSAHLMATFCHTSY